MLAKRSDRAPDKGRCFGEAPAGQVRSVFPVRFHFQLLQEIWQLAQAVGVGEHGAAGDAGGSVQEHVHHGEARRCVQRERRVAEMLVHF